jgi:hypothetical protein
MRRQPFEADFWRKMVDHQNWRGRHKPPFEARFDPLLGRDACAAFAAGLDIGPRSARLYWTDEDAAILTARADRIADIAADRPAGHSYLATLNL